MAREQIWAPWRLDYILTAKDRPEDGCFLCYGLTAGDDRKHWIVCRDPDCFAVLNRYPYTNGHLLIAPYQHKGRLDELTDDELLGCMKMTRRMIAVLDRVLQAQGYNIGLNLGRVAGAGLPGHLHWHLVPRWQGDTNFMPVVADVGVIPQSLEALYDQIVANL